MVCDLQGVVIVENGVYKYLLTDPAIHTAEKKYAKTHTDGGLFGMAEMIDSHECNHVCQRLGLPDTSKYKKLIRDLKIIKNPNNLHTCYIASESVNLNTVPPAKILDIFKN